MWLQGEKSEIAMDGPSNYGGKMCRRPNFPLERIFFLHSTGRKWTAGKELEIAKL
jgi:hypothetical protein